MNFLESGAAGRSLYPALQNKIYFNYGGQGVLSQQVLDQISANFRYIEELGSFSIAANNWVSSEVQALKQVIAQELGVAPKSISLTENTTHGCNIAMWAVNWQKGDRLLISNSEHPSILAIAKALISRFAIELDYFSVGANDPEDQILKHIKDQIQPKTKMLMASHVIWNTGSILPVGAICNLCREHQVLVAIDAAQSVGVLPLDLASLGIDFYAFTGHKWWNGPLGVGGLYINPKILANLEPTFAGWRSLSSESGLIYWRDDAQKFEVATSSYPLYGTLRLAIAQSQARGTQEQRYVRICQLSKYLWQSLAELKGVSCIKAQAPHCGLVSFQVDGQDHNQLSQKLESEYRIMVRSIPEPASLRASVQDFTAIAEIDSLITTLKNLSAELT